MLGSSLLSFKGLFTCPLQGSVLYFKGPQFIVPSHKLTTCNLPSEPIAVKAMKTMKGMKAMKVMKRVRHASFTTRVHCSGGAG